MRGGRCGAGLLALLAGLGLATAAGAMTLEEAFATAYETNPRLLDARAGLRATDEGVAQARAGLRPQVSGNIDYGANFTDNDVQSDTDDPINLGVTATQPLYDGGQTQNNVRSSIATVSATRAQLQALEQQVMFDVVTAYLNIQRDEEFVRLAENNVRVITEQLRASQDRFEVGEVTRTDVSQAQARLAESRANLATAQGALANSRQSFREVVGAEPINLAPPGPLPVVPNSLEDAITIALESHPLILVERFQEAAAEYRIRSEIGGLLPRVDLQGSLNYNEPALFGDSDSIAGETTSASARVRVTVPFYQGGRQYSRVRQAQALASQERAQITTQVRDRRQLVEQAWTQLLVSRAQIRAVREQVEAQRLAFEGVREEAIVGSRTTLDVLDAEQELLDARTDLVAAIRDEYQAAYGLLAAVGDLTVADLDIATVPYDPNENYDLNNARFFGFERTEDTVWEQLWRP